LALTGFPPLPWLLAGASSTAFVVLLAWCFYVRFWTPRRPLPKRWTLTPRPVFSHYERRLYKHLAHALPQHVILAKLPLVRLCQPSDPGRVRYWFELLGTVHVGFVICSPAGRALVALDLDDGRPIAARVQRVKEQVLRACNLPYLRCLPGYWPSQSELQALMPAVPAAATPARPLRRSSGRTHENDSESAASHSASTHAAPPSRSWAPTLAEPKRPAAQGTRWKHSVFGLDTPFDAQSLPVVHELAVGFGPALEPVAAAAPSRAAAPQRATEAAHTAPLRR
jgi:hypothetical protein